MALHSRCVTPPGAWVRNASASFWEPAHPASSARRSRIGIGTPLTGALPASLDYRHTHNSFSVADFVRQYFGVTGPAFAVSTACSSSGKVFGAAQRMIELGLIDAAVVGGVDSLCLTTLYGFNSLQLISSQPCRPFDQHRDGITIGEAAAFGLLERPVDGPRRHRAVGRRRVERRASYVVAPSRGTRRHAGHAVRAEDGRRRTRAIDYIALHGTATPSNDAAEGKAVFGLFGADTPCSSLKGHIGHTLGAAGAVNAVICALALRHDVPRPARAPATWTPHCA